MTAREVFPDHGDIPLTALFNNTDAAEVSLIMGIVRPKSPEVFLIVGCSEQASLPKEPTMGLP